MQMKNLKKIFVLILWDTLKQCHSREKEAKKEKKKKKKNLKKFLDSHQHKSKWRSKNERNQKKDLLCHIFPKKVNAKLLNTKKKKKKERTIWHQRREINTKKIEIVVWQETTKYISVELGFHHIGVNWMLGRYWRNRWSQWLETSSQLYFALLDLVEAWCQEHSWLVVTVTSHYHKYIFDDLRDIWYKKRKQIF